MSVFERLSLATAIMASGLAGCGSRRSDRVETAAVDTPGAVTAVGDPWMLADRNGRIYEECARGARQILYGWIDLKRDPETHLYTRGQEWNYRNEAADHYSSLVLMAHFLEPQLNGPGGALHTTLVNSIRLCTSPSGLPACYDLAQKRPGAVELDGVCEWLRDGLLRITEAIGTDNDWFREFMRLADAVLAEADRRGGLFKLAPEPEEAGNLMQVFTRLAVMSGDIKYLEAAEQLADPYLVQQPPREIEAFSFVDHGCELVPGLTELFVVECRLARTRGNAYREPLRRLLDRLLEVGRHPQSGLWYCRANLTGDQPASQGRPRRMDKPGLSGGRFMPDVPHCWGYVLFAYENYDRATGENRYRAAIEKPMRWLTANRPRFDKLKETRWPWNHSRGCFGDSYESMIILWNRYPGVPGAAEWLDWTTRRAGFRRMSDPNYGPGSGAHDDGCVGRNLCAHMMLQSRGVRAVPYVAGLRCGAVERDGHLYLMAATEEAWSGRLCFDGPRNVYTRVTLDWARINEMPQWFVVSPQTQYRVWIDGAGPRELTGQELIRGLELNLRPGQTCRAEVRRMTP